MNVEGGQVGTLFRLAKSGHHHICMQFKNVMVRVRFYLGTLMMVLGSVSTYKEGTEGYAEKGYFFFNYLCPMCVFRFTQE